jgi:hypothetical protein
MCAVVSILGLAGGVLADATVQLSTSDGAPGGTVTLTMSLTREAGDPAFAGAQVDLILDRSQLGIDAQCSESAAQCDSGLDCDDAEACSLISCQRDPRLPAAIQLIANSPRFQNVEPANKRLRLGVVGPVIPVTTFEDGVVLTCDLDVPASAAFGVQNLSTDRLVVSDEVGDIIPATVIVSAGSIVDPTQLTPAMTATPTSTATPPVGTPTSTPTGSGPPATSTSTSTPGGGGGTPTSTSTSVIPTATHTGTTGGTPTATPTQGGGGGGGGGDGCDCAITPEADRSKGTALIWLSLLPVALVWWRRSRSL